MGIYVDILQGGTNSHGVTVEDFNGIATDLLADGVVGSITNTSGVAPMTGAFAVNAQATPDMTVAVTQGVAYITGTPTSGTSMRVRVKMDAAQNVSIASNSTGGTRYDWLYIKLDPDKMKDPNASASDVATLVTSRSTSSTTDNGTPPTYGYCIAVITVANGASSITNGSIADKRAECLANIVTTPRIADDSVTNAKLDTTAGELGGVWKAWTPTWNNLTLGSGTVSAHYTEIGKTIHYKMTLTWGSGTSASGDVSFTLPKTISSNNYSNGQPIGTMTIRDASAGWYLGMARAGSTTVAIPILAVTSATYVTITGCSSTTPMTWAPGDMMMITGTYEAE
jgi:hypothetical protein